MSDPFRKKIMFECVICFNRVLNSQFIWNTSVSGGHYSAIIKILLHLQSKNYLTSKTKLSTIISFFVLLD